MGGDNGWPRVPAQRPMSTAHVVVATPGTGRQARPRKHGLRQGTRSHRIGDASPSPQLRPAPSRPDTLPSQHAITQCVRTVESDEPAGLAPAAGPSWQPALTNELRGLTATPTPERPPRCRRGRYRGRGRGSVAPPVEHERQACASRCPSDAGGARPLVPRGLASPRPRRDGEGRRPSMDDRAPRLLAAPRRGHRRVGRRRRRATLRFGHRRPHGHRAHLRGRRCARHRRDADHRPGPLRQRLLLLYRLQVLRRGADRPPRRPPAKGSGRRSGVGGDPAAGRTGRPAITRGPGPDGASGWRAADRPANIRLEKGPWWARQDSNLQPDRYERSALTIELRAPVAG